MDNLLFLFVTANKHETHALLQDESFFRFEPGQRSSDPHDPVFYNIGKFGYYNVVHFQLMTQGATGADGAELSINAAIEEYHPDAVILLGISFGKEYSDSKNPSQYIGDVLISEMVADYEKDKVQNGEMLSDGPKPNCGRQLLSVFKYHSEGWDYKIKGRKADCKFGLLLSGDKVVDDREFKEKLMKLYPRAIGGEMEGRGAYAACQRTSVSEWIIVKSICDWADGTKGVNKTKNQITASESVVSLLKYIFGKPEVFNKLPKLVNNTTCSPSVCGFKQQQVEESTDKNDIVGYFINFGVTTCRLFSVHKAKKGLKECKVISYDISNPKDSRYLSGIIEHVKNEIIPYIKTTGEHIFFKAFADSCFSDVFPNEKRRNQFVLDVYSETNLYFNILSQRQTEENLRKLFRNIENGTAIVNIGSQYVDILVQSQNKFTMYNLPISLNTVNEYLKKHAIPEKWDENVIDSLKSYIKGIIKKNISRIKANNIVIIKDELKFMTTMGYPLHFENGNQCISFDEYKKANRSCLFNNDYHKVLNEQYTDKAMVNRLYGFKNGHIILESIFDCIGAETIIPSDELSIHGDISAYIFNVAISGSTTGENAEYMIEAHKIITEMGAVVLSPRIVNGKLCEKTKESDINHGVAIRECDLLFVSNKNKDGYFGEQTGREIYGAYILNKPIAFWREPKKMDRLDYIPHEEWWEIMRVLENK